MACDANGTPIKGSFEIAVKTGKCSHVKLITDATGTAVATYTAPLTPGEDVVGKVFSAFDLAFQSYQGYNWLADFAHAGSVRQQLARILSQ